MLPRNCLFLAEGHAVGALIHGGVAFMGADQNLLQRAVVGGIAMMDALGNSTFNVLVCVGIHSIFPPFPWDMVSMPQIDRFMRDNFSNAIDNPSA